MLRSPCPLLAIGLAAQWAGPGPARCAASDPPRVERPGPGALQTLRPRRAVDTHEDAVTGLAYSPGGTLLASAGRNGPVQLWNPKTGLLLAALPPQGLALAFSPDGKWLLVGGDHGALTLLQVRTRRVVRRLTLHRDPLLSVDWSRDNRFVAVASQDGSVFLIQPGTWRVVRTISNPLRAVREPPIQGAPAGPVRFSPNGRWLATVFGAARQGTPGPVESAALVWDTRTWKRPRTLVHDQFINNIAVAFSPDSAELATATNSPTVEGDITVWGLSSAAGHVLGRQVRGGNAVLFLDHGRLLATEDGPAVLLDARTGDQEAALSQRTGVYGMATTPEGQTLATGDADGTIRIWSIPPSAARSGHLFRAAHPARKRR
jgi:WD40 repeat protein